MIESILASFSSASEVVDPSSPVGVRDFFTEENELPVRVFYPSMSTDFSRKANAGWFVRGLAYFIDGYLHFLFPNLRKYAVFRWLASFTAYVVSFFLPLARADLPMCKLDVPPKESDEKYPLIVFSHGLTGSGEEQALLFTYWAQQGFVVAYVHHCDGSSCMVPRPKLNSHLLYEHPDMLNYDKTFRPRKVRQRQEELHEMKNFILKGKGFDSDLRNVIDDSKVFASGFSFGAATASLEVVTHPSEYTACILLDGWFHIDVGEGFDFPKEVHDAGISIPTLFVGSAQFADMPGISKATANLSHDKSAAHILTKSKHQNFVDVGFWLPAWLLRKVGAVGECDFYATYTELLMITRNFLISQVHRDENSNMNLSYID